MGNGRCIGEKRGMDASRMGSVENPRSSRMVDTSDELKFTMKSYLPL